MCADLKPESLPGSLSMFRWPSLKTHFPLRINIVSEIARKSPEARSAVASTANEIVDWIKEFRSGAGDTATCPDCFIDSVLGSNSTYPITLDFLTAMHERWFTI
jgi:hypothetical protein